MVNENEERTKKEETKRTEMQQQQTIWYSIGSNNNIKAAYSARKTIRKTTAIYERRYEWY